MFYLCKKKSAMSAQAQTQHQPLFFVSQDSDGGYVAKAPKYGIYTQGETWEELMEILFG